jgi:hypothetical protein
LRLCAFASQVFLLGAFASKVFLLDSQTRELREHEAARFVIHLGLELVLVSQPLHALAAGLALISSSRRFT